MSIMPPFRDSAEIPRSIEELEAQYEFELVQKTQSYLDRVNQITEVHDTRMEAVVQNPSREALEGALAWPQARFTNISTLHADETGKFISNNSKLAAELLGEGEDTLLKQYLYVTRVYGLGSLRATQVLSQATSTRNRKGILMATDGLVWQQAQHEAWVYGPGSERVKRAIAQASSRTATTAMKTMLDNLIWKKAQDDTRVYGFASARVHQTISNASNSDARGAMRLGLDTFGWQKLRDDAWAYGPDSNRVAVALRHISSAKARLVMAGLLGANTGHQRASSSSRQNPTPPPRPRAQPRAEPAAKESSKRQEAEQIARQVAAEDRKFGWLASEDPGNVLRVINTVRKLREQAAESGSEISDFQIYVRFRRKIETPNPSDRLRQSFSILDAMMGGKPKGKLPF